MGKTTKNLILLAGVLATLALLSPLATAEEDALPQWQEDTLTGDWGGARADLYRKGIDFGFTHKSDVLSNVSGGLKRGTAWLGHTEARLTLDLDKLWGWQETVANFVYQSDLGSKFNKNYVGAFMGVDNIEVGTNTALFYQAWLQKNFADGHVSLLAGLYPIDTEFNVPETSGIFLQPPYGMANEVAQSGVNGPAIFPLAALGVRAKLTSKNDDFYVQTTITDGVPGDPDNPHGTHIKLGDGDGTFSIIEFGYIPQALQETQSEVLEESETFNKTALGFWRYSGKFDAIDGSTNRHHSQGVYLLAERSLYVEQSHPSQGLAGFLRFGVANESVNQIDWSSSVGLRYHGLISGRDDDIAGVAITVNHAGDDYKKANDTKSAEVNVEWTYRAQIKPYLAIQPTVQYISRPNMDKSLNNVWVIGTRFEIAF